MISPNAPRRYARALGELRGAVRAYALSDNKVTDQQRREVAARLRIEGKPALHADQEFMNVFEDFVADATGVWDYRETEATPEGFNAYCDLLADLIDRPTCEDVGLHSLFRCSVCGGETYYKIYDDPTMWTRDGVAITPRHCPNCGAEVVA